ncbi:MAG: hypothetical protein V4537_14645 [Pseudomonadota bacterium]
MVAIQYWRGDEGRALRLARALEAIEMRPRRDMVTVALCRRFDMPDPSPAAWAAREILGRKFGTLMIRSAREGVGHPAGANALWSGAFEKLAQLWETGGIQASSVMFVEADGCPLRPDWIDLVRREHDRGLARGCRMTGTLMNDVPHINGTLISSISVWRDRQSLHQTPDDQAWDVFHRHAIMQEAMVSPIVMNAYGAGRWSDEALIGASRQSAWLTSTKDDSAIEWAERVLPVRAAAEAAELEARRASPWDQ